MRLTPAGRRLADHGVTILAAVDAARRTSTPTRSPPAPSASRGSPPRIRRSLLPIVADLAEKYPNVRHHVVSEYEPIEAFALLTDDDLDLALTYDYNLAPASPGPVLQTEALWSITWGLGVPADLSRRTRRRRRLRGSDVDCQLPQYS